MHLHLINKPDVYEACQFYPHLSNASYDYTDLTTTTTKIKQLKRV
jgi:hypothetical protein